MLWLLCLDEHMWRCLWADCSFLPSLPIDFPALRLDSLLLNVSGKINYQEVFGWHRRGRSNAALSCSHWFCYFYLRVTVKPDGTLLLFIGVQTPSVCPRAALWPATLLHLNSTNRCKLLFSLYCLKEPRTRFCFVFFLLCEEALCDCGKDSGCSPEFPFQNAAAHVLLAV